MIKRVTAIALLVVRGALRSRFLGVLALLVVGLAVVIPLTVEGDGTALGQARVAIPYSLGVCSVILGLATLWAASGAVSQDVASRRIHLVMTKPVRCIDLWLGQWLGLLMINALLLGVASALVYGVLWRQMQPGRLTAEQREELRAEIFTVRRLVPADEPDFATRAHRMLDALGGEAALPAETSHVEAIQAIRRQLVARAHTVAPGETRQWRFRLEAPFDPRRRTLLRYGFSGASRFREPVSGEWVVGTPRQPDLFRRAVRAQRGGPYDLELPPTLPADAQTLLVRFENASREVSHTAVFDLRRGAVLLVEESAFTMNWIRGTFVLFVHLACLAALGVAIGSLCSFPVASFLSVSAVLVVLCTQLFAVFEMQQGCGHAHHGHMAAEERAWVRTTGEWLINRLETVVTPLTSHGPLRALSEGLLIDGPATARAAAVLLVLYPAVMGAVAVIVLRRRELGLPQPGE